MRTENKKPIAKSVEKECREQEKEKKEGKFKERKNRKSSNNRKAIYRIMRKKTASSARKNCGYYDRQHHQFGAL